MTDLSLNTVRETLISIARDMRDPSQDPIMVHARLTDVKRFLIKNKWSLASIAFGSFASYLGDSELKLEPEIADILREELEGKRGYWNIHVFKENMLSEMRPAYVESYRTLKRLVEISERIASEEQEEVDAMQEGFYILREEYQPDTVGELMVSLATEIVSRLPADFRAVFHNDDETLPLAGFSGLYQGQIQRSEHLDYVQKLLQQIEGQRPFYIDVTILPEYCLVNVR